MSVESVIGPGARQPVDVSFAVACYNAEGFLEQAVQSALAQQGVSVEVLIVDDCSTDGSRALAKRLAGEDPRVRALQTAQNSGPGGARNMAIEHMRGQWFAILDADDLVLPDRTRRLLDLAEQHDAQIVADNLIQFGEGIDDTVMFDIAPADTARKLDLTDYLARSHMFGKHANPGYLKPMIRRDAIVDTGLRYNEQMRIGEDDELIIRALIAGLTYWLSGDAGYRYRRHDQSISHRLSLANLEKMVEAEEVVAKLLPPQIASHPAYRGRWDALMRARAFTRSIEALKNKQPMSAALEIARHPPAIMLYSMPIMARLHRWLGKG